MYRLGFAGTRREARQLVTHAHFTVNGKKVNIPSYLIKPGDVVEVAAASRSSVKFSKLTGEDAPMVTDVYKRQVLGFRRRPGLPRFAQIHAVRRAKRCRDGCQSCDGAWHEVRGSVCEGPWFRP